MSQLVIRQANLDDSEIIFDYIIKLAHLEKFPFEISVTLEALQTNLFSDDSVAKCLIFCIANKPVGFAVYYFTFSTCLGKKGLHLEDLYLEPDFHGKGLGKKIMQYLANIAKIKDCARFEWWVVNTNLPAIRFYKKLGARPLNELSIFRLSGTDLDNLVE